LPALLVGTETEKLIAKRLSSEGFRLAYESKASRGTFDLLALYEFRCIGIQCKKVALPYSLPKTVARRMDAEGERLGWEPVLALHVDGGVRFYAVRELLKSPRAIRIRGDTDYLPGLLRRLQSVHREEICDVVDFIEHFVEHFLGLDLRPRT